MSDEHEAEAPEPVEPPVAAGEQAVERLVAGLDSDLANTAAITWASSQMLGGADARAVKLLRDMDRQARLMETLQPPQAISAMLEVSRTFGRQGSYAGTHALGPSITSALAILERSVLAHATVPRPGWLAGLPIVPTDSLVPKLPTEFLGSTVHARLTEQFERITGPALDLQRLLDGFAVGGLARLELGQTPAEHQAWKTVSRLNKVAVQTWDYLGSRPDRLAVMSPRLAAMPVVEVYAATQAATLLSVPKRELHLETVPALETTLDELGDAFEERLAALDPALVLMYRGGVERVEQGGTDWARQALTSFRELSTHTLHLLAPDDAVTPWALPTHAVNGKLTRRARLEYIVREVGSGDLAAFLKKDLDAALALFDLMHTVHKKEPALDQRQLRLIYNRVRGVISALLEAAGR